jgi:hypothetical protein
MAGGERRIDVAKDLKIMPSMLYNWGKKFKPTPKKKAINKSPNKMATAIVYLHHARDAAVVQITQDPQRFDDPVYQFAMMALKALEGKNDGV